jgi:AcrR family transcriptional regulator
MVEAGRADAQRNRTRILEVAYSAFANDPDVSLNTIAKLAGVGAGTLYRHFPTREALLLAVYQEELDALVGSVDQLLADHSPLEAFRLWVTELAAQMRVKHGLGEALTSPDAQAAIEANYAPVTEAIRRFLVAATASGEVRPELDPSDVLLLLGTLWRVPNNESGLKQADRMLDLIVGLFAP